MNAPLYNTQILRLAASIPHHRRLTDPMASVAKRSPVCGSEVIVDVDLGDDGRVAALGVEVRACALGQASAALVARHAPGRALDDIRAARAAIAAWFAGEGAMPDWPGFDLLAPARDYPARQGAILLPFDAAIAALEDDEVTA